MVIGGDSGNPTTTAAIATVYTAAEASHNGVDIVAGVLKALRKLAAIVWGENGENEEIVAGGE